MSYHNRNTKGRYNNYQYPVTTYSGKNKKNKGFNTGWTTDLKAKSASELGTDIVEKGGKINSVSIKEDIDEETLIQLEEQGIIKVDGVEVPPIIIPGTIKKKIKYTMNEIPDVEWSAMFDVERNDSGYKVTDIYFPEQIGSHSTVDFEEHNTGYDGIVHSHHNMDIGFSSIDDDGINMDYDVSVLVAWDDKAKDKLKWEGCVRLDYDDRNIYRESADIEFDEEYNFEDYKQQVQDNFSEKTTKLKSGGTKKLNGTGKSVYDGGLSRYSYHNSATIDRIRCNNPSTGRLKYQYVWSPHIYPVFDYWVVVEDKTVELEDGDAVDYVFGDTCKATEIKSDYITVEKLSEKQGYKLSGRPIQLSLETAQDILLPMFIEYKFALATKKVSNMVEDIEEGQLIKPEYADKKIRYAKGGDRKSEYFKTFSSFTNLYDRSDISIKEW